jgi:nicotinamidase-related amidase
MKPALLVIDMQEVFFNEDPSLLPSLENAALYINAAIEIFRERELPVIVIEDVEEADGRVPGSPGFETTSRIELEASDPRIRKTYGNAFNKTELDSILSDLEVDTLILTGYEAANCVLSTSRGAKDLDYRAILLRGGIAGQTPERVETVQSWEDIISYGALKAVLENY